MINIVFEGSFVDDKKEIIKELYKIYSKKYKIGFINDIDCSSTLYKKTKKTFDKNVQIAVNKKFNSLIHETVKCSIDYLFLRKKLYLQNNDINFFCRNYFSIYSYQSVLLEHKIEKYDQFMDNLLNNLKFGEKEIDLLIFFDINVNKTIKRFKQEKYDKREIKQFKKFNIKLKDFIRYNNAEYKLLVINDKDNVSQTIEKIRKKVDEIIIDKKKSEGTKWFELYKKDIQKFHTPDQYIKYKLKYKSLFIKKIIKYVENGKVIEMGCGTGLVSGYLQKKGLKVIALDLSQKVLNYAKEISNKSDIIIPCEYKKGDILNLKYKNNTFDVSYSNGVLEHFKDDEIIKTLKKQMNISKYVIFGVPSTYFNMGDTMFGNERRLKLNEWKKLIYNAGGKIVEQTGFHYYKLSRRIIEVKKWFKPKAFWLFVIEKN